MEELQRKINSQKLVTEFRKKSEKKKKIYWVETNKQTKKLSINCFVFLSDFNQKQKKKKKTKRKICVQLFTYGLSNIEHYIVSIIRTLVDLYFTHFICYLSQRHNIAQKYKYHYMHIQI